MLLKLEWKILREGQRNEATNAEMTYLRLSEIARMLKQRNVASLPLAS